MIKTIERAHAQEALAEDQAPRNYAKALAVVTEELEHFPKFLQHRNKQRLTRIYQYLIRMRKLALRSRPHGRRPQEGRAPREPKEVKALVAAKLNKSIESELLQRLKQGTYGDIYNFPEMHYNAASTPQDGAAGDGGRAMVDEEEEERLVEYIEAAEDFESDMEDLEDKGRKARVVHPYDDDEEEKPAMATAAAF
ncbi:hypothetical protein JL721_12270 [Aureococcus anophagefferens]|nr:hypothetical protein JL721_12270 [Aureococcus anophagefferens]